MTKQSNTKKAKNQSKDDIRKNYLLLITLVNCRPKVLKDFEIFSIVY